MGTFASHQRIVHFAGHDSIRRTEFGTLPLASSYSIRYASGDSFNTRGSNVSCSSVLQMQCRFVTMCKKNLPMGKYTVGEP
jgi:hypothetical protein